MEEYLTSMIVYWYLKYYSMRVSVATLIWWMEEKNYNAPTSEELNVYRERFLYYLFL